MGGQNRTGGRDEEEIVRGDGEERDKREKVQNE